MKEVLEALDKLGVKGGKIIIHWFTDDRAAVYIDDEYFAIWDAVKKTFVD